MDDFEVVYAVAQVCHGANRAYCKTLGDVSQPEWYQAPDWQRDSAIKGVRFHLENPTAGPEASHESWLREKLETGWVYGEMKDPDAQTHPCMVPYDELPEDQQIKDKLFIAIVDVFR